jgi:hypothetical protein
LTDIDSDLSAIPEPGAPWADDKEGSRQTGTWLFLALVLKKALEDRIAALGRVGSWPEDATKGFAATAEAIEQNIEPPAPTFEGR